MRKYFWILALVCLPTVTLAGTLQDMVSKFGKDLKNSDVKIAVMAFSVGETGGNQDSFVVRERISTLLVQNKNITVIERSLLEKVLQEQKLQMSGAADAARKIGELAGATAILSGTISELANGEVEVNARIIDVGTGEVVSAGQAVLRKDWKYFTPVSIDTVAVVTAKSAQDYFNRGVRYHAELKRNMAREFYSKAISLKPDLFQAYYGRGAVHAWDGDYDSAIADFTQAIAHKLDFTEAYFARANAYSAKGEHDKALLDMTRTIELTPKNDGEGCPDSGYYFLPDGLSYIGNYLRRGEIYSDKGEPELAIHDYNKVIAICPRYDFVYRLRGNAYFLKSAYPEAIADYSEVINISSSVAGNYSGRGNVYYSIGDYDKAIEDYTAAIELNTKKSVLSKNAGCDDSKTRKGGVVSDACLPAELFNGDFLRYYSSRANAYYMGKEYLKSIADYNRAIELAVVLTDDLGPSPYSYIYINRGNAYRANKETQKALADYNKAIELDPKTADAYYKRAEIMWEGGEAERALFDLNKVIELNPKHETVYYVRGAVLLELKENKKAISDFDKMIEINPGFSDAYRLRGDAYFNLLDYVQAIESLNKAIELGPTDSSAYDSRIWAYYMKGDYDKTIANCTARMEKDPSPQLRKLRGHSYYFKGEYDKAISDFKTLLTHDEVRNSADEVARVCEIMGQAYAEMRDYRNAIKTYTKGLDGNPSQASILHRLRAEAYYSSGDYKKSAEDVSKALKLSPDSANRMRKLLDSLKSAGYQFQELN